MKNQPRPPNPETLRMMMRMMLKNFGNAERRSAGSMIGAPTMRKGYLSACHLENSEGEDSPAKLVKRILDEGSGRKGCFPKEFTKKVNDGEEPVIFNWPRKYETPVKGGEPHDRSNGEEQRPD